VRLPYDRGQLVTYYLLLSLVRMLTSSWMADYVAEFIRLGSLSSWLLRPSPYILRSLSENIGEKVVKLPILLPLMGLLALAFRHDLRLPADVRVWLLFALSLPMAAAITFLLDFVTGSLAFWVQDVNGLVRLEALLSALLSGQFVPLALFPAQLSGFLDAQPFRYTISFPLEVLLGKLSPAAVALGFALQAAYCLGLWAAYRLVWRYGLRSYAASGA
jgi:ABC-2 type transport system permease protein